MQAYLRCLDNLIISSTWALKTHSRLYLWPIFVAGVNKERLSFFILQFSASGQCIKCIKCSKLEKYKLGALCSEHSAEGAVKRHPTPLTALLQTICVAPCKQFHRVNSFLFALDQLQCNKHPRVQEMTSAIYTHISGVNTMMVQPDFRDARACARTEESSILVVGWPILHLNTPHNTPPPPSKSKCFQKNHFRDIAIRIYVTHGRGGIAYSSSWMMLKTWQF